MTFDQIKKLVEKTAPKTLYLWRALPVLRHEKIRTCRVEVTRGSDDASLYISGWPYRSGARGVYESLYTTQAAAERAAQRKHLALLRQDVKGADCEAAHLARQHARVMKRLAKDRTDLQAQLDKYTKLYGKK